MATARKTSTAAPFVEGDGLGVLPEGERIPVAAPARFELVPLARLVESPANHRKKTWGAMDELIESVRAKGVLQPILARPVKGIGSNLLEIVFGHRRFRAANEAGLETIPAVVRELSDVDALEANVIENLQRADVHPLEEAEGYEQLLQQTDRPYTVEDIAAKVGKSRGYVYGRMKLLALCADARKPFYEGQLSASVALLVARIPSADLQKKAIAELLRFGSVSFSHAADVIQRDFMLQLGIAPFDRGDAELVPGAGPCTTCPKRSGNQPELFGDVKSADVCSDPVCFRAKADAAWARRAAEAEAGGRKVLSAKETKATFQGDFGTYVRHDAEFVNLADTCGKDPKYRSYKKLLGKHAKDAAVLARAPSGDVVELVPKAELNKLLKKAGVDFKSDREATRLAGPRASAEDVRRAKEEAEVRDEVRRRVQARILEKLRTTEPDRELWLLVIDEQRLGDDGLLDDRWPRPPKETPHAYDKRLAAELEKLGEPELRSIALALSLGSMMAGYLDGAERLRVWAGVDEKKVLAEVRAARKVASLAPAALVTWEPDPKRKGIWIGKGGGRVYQVEVDRPNGKGFSIKTLKPGGAQVGSWGQASPTGGLEEAKARCEEDARAAAPAKKGGRRG
jgi:ParB/RepB/Spo0J family partition protein